MAMAQIEVFETIYRIAPYAFAILIAVNIALFFACRRRSRGMHRGRM